MNSSLKPNTKQAFPKKDSRKIRQLFDDIAGKYDTTNSAMSLGIHKRWKKRLTAKVNPQAEQKILDCATGTGDIAELIKWQVPSAEVYGLDFSSQMIDLAKKRSEKKAIPIQYQVGDIQELPFDSNLFDAVTISFGLRNVADTALGLSEMIRVLKPGGTLYILEFGTAPSTSLGSWFETINRWWLPFIGSMITGEKKAYEYLSGSSEQFPSGEAFLELAEKAICRNGHSIESLNFDRYFPGMVFLYSITKSF
jgi:demethylmenaquinone methyltransferase/2-methoxy-6-polyprenyl-1,4-benzoquinol methylase